MMDSVSEKLVMFVGETKFEDLPQDVVHEAKRVLLDSIGCALAGIITDKGRIGVELARRLGGPPEASIIGIGDKVSCSSAAFANGELVNALDYDTVVTGDGHVALYVIPASLAVAESVGASGKDLILATVLAHEISIRISDSLSDMVLVVQEGPDKGKVKWPRASGYSKFIIGGTLGVSKILKLDRKKMSYALGIAGHFCPVPTFTKYFNSAPSAMTKYGSAGWISTGGVIAALLAEMGYVGDTTVFDDEYGFWRFYASEKWEPEALIGNLSKTWRFLDLGYKLYPCCRVFHGLLDCFVSIIDSNKLMPEDIESVKAFCHPLVKKPIFESDGLATHVSSAFNLPYVLAAAAHRVKIGADWQDLDTMKNPKILEFMKRVSYEPATAPVAPSSGRLEVVAKGKTFKEETMSTKAKITDEELVEKFRHNASRILSQDKMDKAIKLLSELERVENISELAKQVVL